MERNLENSSAPERLAVLKKASSLLNWLVDSYRDYIILIEG
jgi:hypothetical protein